MIKIKLLPQSSISSLIFIRVPAIGYIVKRDKSMEVVVLMGRVWFKIR